MCEGSVYVKHRRSTEKEELVLKTIPDYGSIKGFYPPRGSLLVCTLPGTKAIVDEVKLALNVPWRLKSPTANWNGKKNVEVTLVAGYYGTRSGDSMKMPDGCIIPFQYIEDGVRIGIGREVKRDLDKALALDQIRADVPHDTDAEKRAELDDLAREYARDETAENEATLAMLKHRYRI